MFSNSKTLKRLRNIAVAVVLALAQILAPLTPLIKAEIASAAPVCTVDTAGANDEPGQKDLTKLCIDYSGTPTSVATTWNWDETGTSGANTMDACNLFDTDGDGNINYAVCVTTTGDPAALQTITTYSCGDAKIDRCTSPATPISSGTTSCTVTQQNTDPFASGSSAPKDTQGACTIQLSTIGGATAKLIDVCSYPSAQPNSDPSDCVIIRNSAGKVEVIKDIVPNADPGLFNLSIDGPQANDTTTVNNVGDNGTTGEVVVKDGTVTIGETAGTNTSLTTYSTSIICRDLNGTGAIVAQSTPSGSPRQLSFTLPDQADVVCIITNTAAGSITIIKDAVPNSAQDFGFTTTGTGLSSFILDDDADATRSNTQTFNNLAANTYTITEGSVTGWDLAAITCSQGATVVKTATAVSITLAAGENVTCTFRNELRGQIIVTKQTNPAADPTQFSVTASGTGNIAGNATQPISTAQSVTYSVGHGTYAVSEQALAGWAETSNNCSNLVINGNTPLVNGVPTRTCTIVNTKQATLTIIKDALPNDPQDFGFSVLNLPNGNFSLDDDTDATLPNQRQYTNLAPGNYSVTEQATPGWSLTGLTCNTNNFTANGGTVSVTLAAGQNTTCTFTNTKLGSIGGLKYTANADGSLGTVLSGWTIFIDANNNGILDVNESSDVTDQNGAYEFTNLLPGNYALHEILLAGWTQIFGPAPVALSAGQTSTGNNFGNFQNGSISGYKFNDVNGNGQDNNEPKLSGWTITLYNDGPDVDTDLDDVVTSTQTDANGNYTFGNLAPGTYAVCETQQANWVQTFPANNSCHTIVINVSGETNPNTNFGNQGRGNIQVIKNVDTNGDGIVDIFNAGNWTWDINGSGNFASGSTQNVAASSYAVSEDQQTNFHVVSVVCDNQVSAVSQTAQVTVAVGATVVCTFTNARDTGTITVRKLVNPTTDTGLFNLNINGVAYATDIGHGQGTGTITVPTGTYNVSETAGTNTTLSNYLSSYVCSNNLSSQGTATGNFSLTTGQDVVCVFTNVRQGHIIINKQTVPTTSTQSFGFTASYNANGFSLSNGQSNDSGNLAPGTYNVSETATAGWDLQTPVVCSDQSNPSSISLSAGETVTCTFVNLQRGQIIVNKQTNPANDPTQFSVTATGNGNIAGNATRPITTAQSVTYDVAQGTYAVSEQALAGWTETSNNCSNLVIGANTPLVNGVPTLTCTIVNTKFATLTIIKDAVPNDAQDFAFSVLGLPGGNFSLDDDADAALSNQQQYTTLLPGNYSVTELSTPGWSLTGLTCDTNNFNANGGTVTVVLAAGQNTTCTFTNTKLGSISGTKFTANANGAFGPALSGWTIFIDTNANGILDQNESSDVTDQNGAYEFTNLLPSTYTLLEIVMPGWTQIVAPTPVILLAGQTSTGNNFGNFQNGSISGYKFNDVNGNGLYDTEPKLSGWTITLYNDGPDADNDLDDFVASIPTDVNGNYVFDNLAPGTYAVCETQQANWTQTFPSNNGCHTIVIDVSGETNSDTNFGNQGRGNIQVIKNVDTDGDGTVDIFGATTWTWDIDGAGNFATGTTQNVAAGSYAVSEDQQINFHVVNVVCDNQAPVVSQSTRVTVPVGATVVCTFTNARDTGTITINKLIDPTTDGGLFDLNINGVAYATDISSGQGTGMVTVPTGTYAVSESAGTNTSLADYTSSYECNNNQNGPGIATSSFTLTTGQNVVCTFTNVRHSSISGTKYEVALGATTGANGTALSGWTIFIDANLNGILDATEVSVVTDAQGAYTFDHLAPGTYQICEVMQTNWFQVFPATTSGCYEAVVLAAGEDLVDGDFGNHKDGLVCVNNVFILLSTTQNATSGPATGNNNTTVGNIQTGGASNSNTTFTNINLACGGQGGGPTPGTPVTPADTPVTPPATLVNTGQPLMWQTFVLATSLMVIALGLSRIPGRNRQ